MEYPIEWRQRADHWLEKLQDDIYAPVGKMEWEGFATREQLPYADAMQRAFAPMPRGTKWGREWEYLWVRATVTVPDACAGERLVLRVDAGGESCVYINGDEFGGRRNDWVRDQLHRISDLVLTTDARPGETFEVALEAYAGHEFPSVRFGPVTGWSPENPTVGYHPKDPEELRCSVGDSGFGIWNELAYQLYIDVKTVQEAVLAMNGLNGRRGGGGHPDPDMVDHSLRECDLWQALKDFTVMVNFEQDAAGRNRDYQAARDMLAPVLAKKNGDTAPEFFAFGHAHIDVAWLWPLEETERKVLRTFAAQLRHMDEYPGYKFLQSQPHLYRWAKEKYPKLYARIKEKVAAGQWIAEGGMWVEADTNVASGEALIRQFVHGKRFFKDEFGVDNKMLWLPDVFGYSAALPQIMRGCVVDTFSTQKIWWAYNGGDPFPHQYFNWVGLDGSEVRTFLHQDYNSDTHPGRMIERWNKRRQKYGIRGFLVPFGYGDGGGGPCRDFIEYLLREEDLEGVPKVKMAAPQEFFDWHPAPTETYVGELYLQVHRGVQTSQAKTKKGNRKSELALRETEFLGVLAKLQGYDYPLSAIDEHWKQVLLHQFHDILPGSSIARVYAEAEAAYAAILADLSRIQSDMADNLLKPAEAVTVFNSLIFDRTAVVELPEKFKGAAASGEALPVQDYDGKRVAVVEVPSCGSITVNDSDQKVAVQEGAAASVTAHAALLENNLIKVTFNDRGEITSIYNKEKDAETLSGLGNELLMFRDIPVSYEAWDVDTSYEFCPVELPEKASFKLISSGPVIAAIQITRKINCSTLTQTVSLKMDTARVDFETTVDWNEIHMLLKVAFAPDVYAEEAIHSIQFGHVKRPNHRSRPYDFDRFEVVNHHWTALCEEGRGFAVLNDCKYGCNVLGNSIRLSLLRSPFSPDPNCDRGVQQFTYSCYPFATSLRDSGLVQEGYDLNCPVSVFKGTGTDGSRLSLDADNIMLEAMKPAEDGSGDTVLRLYEIMRTRTDAVLTLNLPCAAAYECNMLEEDGTPLTVENGKIDLRFKPFEIKTIRLKH